MTLPGQEGVRVNDRLCVPEAVRAILHDRLAAA